MTRPQTRDEEREPIEVRRLRLDVTSGADSGASFEPDDNRCVVGTASGATLRLEDPKVSRYHLEVSRNGGVVVVEDLGSRNGTWIHGLRVDRAQVPPDTRIQIGDTTILVRDGEPRTVEPDDVDEIPGFIAVDPRSVKVAGEIRRVATSNATVQIRGETGTGKEMVARALHALSPRSEQPFVVVDCGSMAPTLVASELFGHERGAFTGADRRRQGAFERADGGTLFLDEIGELPLGLQPALLGALERRQFRRVGGDQEISVDVRMVSATHRDLRESVNDGSFRADLYYRLAVARITVPPLRKRPADIPALVEHFVTEMTGESSDEIFGPDVLEALMRHRFSGNVRELRNVVESALAVGDVRLDTTRDSRVSDPGVFMANPESPTELLPYGEARSAELEKFEKRYLERLVERCGSNASAASRLARMDRKYLVSLLRKHGLR